MNAKRRKRLEEAVSLIAEARSIIEEVMEDEQEAYDNLPESIMYSDRGESMADGIDQIEQAVSSLEDAESLEETFELFKGGRKG
jgi:hypothetical protein